ncbi:MAG: SRPBCC domain-containing protein [Acidimicrobiales bacterium]
MDHDEATLARAGERPVLRFERHLPQPVEAVWRAVTDPVAMRSWFPTRIEIGEWRVGATLTHHFDGHDIGPLPGVVVVWDPPHRVRFTWGGDTIGFELAAAPGGGTVFVLTEELSADHAARNAAGWEACLDQLVPRTDGPSWQERFEHYVAAFEPVLGEQEGPPAGYRATTAD